MKHSIYLIIFLFVTCISTQAQKINYHQYYHLNWLHVKLNSNYKPQPSDTVIAVVSCREFFKDSTEFLSDQLGKELHYFLFYLHDDNWEVKQCETMNEMLSKIPKGKHNTLCTEGLGRNLLVAVDRAIMYTRTYGQNIIQFDWPTDFKSRKRTGDFFKTLHISNEASYLFAKCIDEMSVNAKTITKSLSFNIFNHSMGNLLLLHASKNSLFKNLPPKTFDNVILNAACVNKRKHAKWLSNINISTNLYVTQNKKDFTLKGAKFLLLKKQLGQSSSVKKLAPNATYIDFSGMLNEEHNYFLYNSTLTKHPILKHIYTKILSGETLLTDASPFTKAGNVTNKFFVYE